MEYQKINLDWITNGIKPDSINWAEKFAGYLAEKPDRNDNLRSSELSTSQLRKFFGELKRIQAIGFEKKKVDFAMLKAKLAYASGRSITYKKPGKIEDFRAELSKGIDKVETVAQFKNFVNLTEAIVAYHKAFVKE